MKITKQPKALKMAILALSLQFSSAAFGQDHLTGVEFSHTYTTGVRLMGGPSSKTMYCDDYHVMDRTLWMTCKAGERADPNGSEICSVTDNLPKSDKEKRVVLSQAMNYILTHQGLNHNTCLKQAVKMKMGDFSEKNKSMGQDWIRANGPAYMEGLFGKDWSTLSHQCATIEIMNRCADEMGIK